MTGHPTSTTRAAAVIAAVLTLASSVLSSAPVTAQDPPAAAGPPSAAPSPQPSAVLEAGDTIVDGRRIPPGTSRFRMTATSAGREHDMGALVQVTSITEDGGVLQVVQTTTGPRGENTDTSRVLRRTMAPLTLRGHNEGASLVLNFAGTRVTGTRTDSEGSAQPIDQVMAVPVFDSSIMDLVAAALPLRAGYEARLPVYIYEQAGLVWYSVRVVGDAPDAPAPSWLVAMTIPEGVVRYTIAKADRRVLDVAVTFTQGDLVVRMTRQPD